MADVDAWPESAGVMAVGVGLELLGGGGGRTDNMLSVSCKDAQHINRDMLHHDGFRLCASSWDKSGNGSAEMGARDHSVSRLSVFQHHFWTGVPVRGWEEAGEHPASGKQTGRESGAPAPLRPHHSPTTSQQGLSISKQLSNWLMLVKKEKKD